MIMSNALIRIPFWEEVIDGCICGSSEVTAVSSLYNDREEHVIICDHCGRKTKGPTRECCVRVWNEK